MTTEIVKGKLVTVDNAERKFGSALSYIAIQVEDDKGEKCLLFTKDEIAKAEIRVSKNPEDLAKKGFFTKLFY